ncbi:MAG TPA: glycoside hydrolase family 15 protein [Mycobacteriales bacterium]|nr:glycoside hydrolase family 15 protein [Mycobacteriales bacterium]
MNRIEDYALIGDSQTAALVGRDGSIDWLCLPAFDSGACFAALLGADGNGRWLLAPVDPAGLPRRRYRDDTLILETTWHTATGSVEVLDFMPPRGEAPDVVRIVRGLTGRVELRSDLRIRFDYGRVRPWIRRLDGQLGAVAGPDSIWLRAPVPVDEDGSATFAVSAGDSVAFVLSWHPSYAAVPEPVDAERALRETTRFWTSWAARAQLPRRWREPVLRSLITLKALTYAPTGGIVAAATTSLPEQLGGPRNWDYRYCWLRDAGYTLQTLLDAGYVTEARAWREWLLRAVAGDPADLQIVYSLTGRRRLTEWTVPWLPGYQGSAPVRVGNAAAEQFQLDVWGEVLDTLHRARTSPLGVEEDAWDLQTALLDFLEGHWSDPDTGLWEIRGEPRPFVHSKVMAWAGFDRAVRAVERTGLDGPVQRWRALRDKIHAEVCDRGYDADRNTFTQFYGSRGLDAALLLIPQVGFLPPDDPRVAGTVAAVGRELLRDGFLLRYDPSADGGVDALPGGEGAFLACSFWYADALALIGRRDEAGQVFERLLGLRNDVGLLSEEYDPRTRQLLGNIPQAYSHVFLVQTARNLDRAGAATG